MTLPKVKSYSGVFKAKRLGWDEPKGGLVTKYDILDPYDYDDDELVGKLRVWDFAGAEHFKRGRRYMVNGQYVDPKTIEPVDDKATAELCKPSEKAEAKSPTGGRKLRGSRKRGKTAAQIRSADDRRKQREHLFKERGGEKKGYIICHGCGLKCHYADPGTPSNPKGYARFVRGKIFTMYQGGGYEQVNLLPECFGCNRGRKVKPMRPENMD